MREMREAIANDCFREWRQALAAVLRPEGFKSRAKDFVERRDFETGHSKLETRNTQASTSLGENE
jgi:hypothetical protein